MLQFWGNDGGSSDIDTIVLVLSVGCVLFLLEFLFKLENPLVKDIKVLVDLLFCHAVLLQDSQQI